MALADGSGTTTAVRDEARGIWIGLGPGLATIRGAALDEALGAARHDLIAFLAGGEAAQALATRVERPAALDPAALIPFQPRSFRDFSIWEEHMTVLATGTPPGCCGLEVDRWPRRGDEVALAIEGVGTLHNRLEGDNPPPCD